MIFYIEYTKELAKKFLELTSSYSKVANYKVKIQMSIASLYSINEQIEFEIKKHNTIYIGTPKVKYKHKYNKII
jgi:hypothetical protein